MGRQTDRTKRMITQALSELLSRKKYSQITMQEIADLANIGRSTLYSHYATKEDVLTGMCSGIFDSLLQKEHSISSHTDPLLAMLVHVKENRKVITGIFASEGIEIFSQYCQRYFGQFIEEHYLAGYNEESEKIPRDFLIHYVINTFVESVRWWTTRGMQEEAEQIAEYLRCILYWTRQGLQEKKGATDAIHISL